MEARIIHGLEPREIGARMSTPCKPCKVTDMAHVAHKGAIVGHEQVAIMRHHAVLELLEPLQRQLLQPQRRPTPARILQSRICRGVSPLRPLRGGVLPRLVVVEGRQVGHVHAVHHAPHLPLCVGCSA